MSHTLGAIFQLLHIALASEQGQRVRCSMSLFTLTPRAIGCGLYRAVLHPASSLPFKGRISRGRWRWGDGLSRIPPKPRNHSPTTFRLQKPHSSARPASLDQIQSSASVRPIWKHVWRPLKPNTRPVKVPAIEAESCESVNM